MVEGQHSWSPHEMEQAPSNHHVTITINIGEAGRQVRPRHVKLINGMDTCSVKMVEITSAGDASMSEVLRVAHHSVGQLRSRTSTLSYPAGHFGVTIHDSIMFNGNSSFRNRDSCKDCIGSLTFSYSDPPERAMYPKHVHAFGPTEMGRAGSVSKPGDARSR
ncbi:hypothetical protein CC79DRAFT_1130216 [Sarocladium strictum]